MADNGQDTKSARRQGDRKLIMRLASYAKPYWKYFLIALLFTIILSV